MIIQTVVQNALRRLRKQKGVPTSASYTRSHLSGHESDVDDEKWNRQEILPWLIAFAVGLAIVAAIVVAFV